MHIAQTYICFKYLPVYQALHEYLFKAQTKSYPKEPALQPQLIRSRQVTEPNNASRNNIDEYEV